MAGGNDSPSTITQTTKSEPNPAVQGFLDPYMGQALSVAMTPYQTYSGQQIAGFNPTQQAGFDMTTQNANQGQTAVNGAQSALSRILSGNGFTPGTNPMMGMNNPYLQQSIDAVSGDVTRNYNNAVAPTTDATFARAGAFGGSAWQNAQSNNQHQLTTDLGNISNNARMADYTNQQQLQEANLNRQTQAAQTGIQQQLAAAGMIPGLNQAGYANASALLGIGGTQQQQQQNELTQAYQNWLTQQQAPYRSLSTMQNAINSIMGAGGTNTATAPNPNQVNPVAAGLGGAASGAAIGANFGPWGAGIGAGVGLLGGML